MLKIENEKDIITDKVQLKQLFLDGCKNPEDFKTGIEFEKISVSNVDFKNVPYEGTRGIRSFLNEIKKHDNWNDISENENVIGLAKNSDLIALEPGAQLEISLAPEKTIQKIKEKIDDFNQKTAQIGKEFGLSWLGYGISPVSTFKNIKIIPKDRYKRMSEYLPQQGALSQVMMRETAGIQVALDYASEEDAVQKLHLSIALSPIVSAMFANSPIRDSKDTGYKSFRANSWLQTDEKRCGLIAEKLFNSNRDFSFDDYVDILLDTPMIFIVRNAKIIKMNGITFREFLKNKYEGFKATMEDWQLHSSLFFPDVRLKNYIEIRNHDCQKTDLIFAVPALWKGLLYDKSTTEVAFEIIKDLNWQQLNAIRQTSPKNGLNDELWNIAQELITIAKNSLKNEEKTYLEPLEELASQKLTPADVILKNWYGSWNKDLKRLIKYVKI